jgi:hypothetical protein
LLSYSSSPPHLKPSPYLLYHSSLLGRFLLISCPIPPHLEDISSLAPHMEDLSSLAFPFHLTWKISPHCLSHSSSPGRFILIGCPIPPHLEDFSSLAVAPSSSEARPRLLPVELRSESLLLLLLLLWLVVLAVLTLRLECQRVDFRPIGLLSSS